MFKTLFFLLYPKYTISPIASQTASLNQFVQPRPYIIAKQTITPKIGTNGTNGVLNSRFISGSVFLNTITETQTKINANKVPILVISPTISPGTKAANAPTITKMTRFALYGVLYLECKSPNAFGNKPSLPIA